MAAYCGSDTKNATAWIGPICPVFQSCAFVLLLLICDTMWNKHPTLLPSHIFMNNLTNSPPVNVQLIINFSVI